MKNLLLVVLTAATLGLAVLAWSQARELSALRTQQPVLAEARTTLERQLTRAQDNVRELEKQLEKARQETSAARLAASPVPAGANAAGPGAGGRPATTEAAVGAMLPGIANLLDRPEMQRAMAAQQKAQVERRFNQLFKQLGLPAEQTEKLKALLVERETTALDTVMAASQKGLNPMQNQAEIAKLIQTSQSETDTQIKELLGDTNYQQYQTYRQQEPQRNTVAQLQQNLGYTDQPLTYAQMTQLTQLLADTNPRRTTGTTGAAGTPTAAFTIATTTTTGPAGSGGTASSSPQVRTVTTTNASSSLISDEAIARSNAFLTPTQVQSLQELQAQQKANAANRVNFLPALTAPPPATTTPTTGGKG